MNRKMLRHGLMIAAIVIAVFAAAALTPAKTYAETTGSVTVANLAKIDYENRARLAGVTMIADNEIPLAAAPSEKGFNLTLWLIVVSVSAIMSGIVIFEEYMDKRSNRH